MLKRRLTMEAARVAIARFFGWAIFGEFRMCCAHLHERRHPAERLLDLANRWRHDRHCARCAAWEAQEAADPIAAQWEPPDALDARVRLSEGA